MIANFLRLFRAHRDIEAELEQAATARIHAEDDARLWRARCESAESRADRLEAAEAKCAKTTANFLALQAGQDIVPFPDVYAPVVRKEEAIEPETRRRQARGVVDELEREFQKEFGAMVDRDIEQQFGRDR